jgi:hypothetical protein
MRSRALLVCIIVFTAANIVLLMLALNANHAVTTPLPTVAVMPSDTSTPVPPTRTNTPSQTSTATLSASATETSIPVVSDTPLSTDDLRPSATVTVQPTQEGSSVPVTIKIKEPAGTQARSGPGISYEIVRQVDFDSVYTVHAYARDYFGHIWYLVDLPNDLMGWILEPAAWVVTGIADKVAIVATIPATPTLTPTFTLTPGRGLEEQLQMVPIFSGVGPELREL